MEQNRKPKNKPPPMWSIPYGQYTKIKKQPECSSIEEWIKKVVHTDNGTLTSQKKHTQ